MENAALFVNPEEVSVEDKRVVIQAKPESVIVLSQFIQAASKYGTDGFVNEKTGVPLAEAPNGSWTLKAKLFRSAGAGVEPITRHVVGYEQLYDVYATDGPGHAASVAYVGAEEITLPDAVRVTKTEGGGVRIEGIPFSEFMGLADDAAANLKWLQSDWRHDFSMTPGRGVAFIQRLVDLLGVNAQPTSKE